MAIEEPDRVHSSRGEIAAIVPAAGLSRRMGLLKQLAGFAGRPMIVHVAANLREAGVFARIHVVTGHAGIQVADAIRDCGVTPIENPDYASGGMLSSVKAGLRAIPGHCVAFALVLGDQPAILPATYRLLASDWRAHRPRLLAPVFDGKRGHPVFFSAELVDEVLALPGDATLKTLTDRYRASRREMQVEDPGVVTDVDTPDALARAEQIWLRGIDERSSREAGPGE